MTGDDRAAAVAEALGRHILLTPVRGGSPFRCTCGWSALWAVGMEQHPAHIAAAVLAALDAQPGDAGQVGGLTEDERDEIAGHCFNVWADTDDRTGDDVAYNRFRAEVVPHVERILTARAVAAPTPSADQTCPGPHDHMARCWNAGAARDERHRAARAAAAPGADTLQALDEVEQRLSRVLSLPHEDWCCANGCTGMHGTECPGCDCLVDTIRRAAEGHHV